MAKSLSPARRNAPPYPQTPTETAPTAASAQDGTAAADEPKSPPMGQLIPFPAARLARRNDTTAVYDEMWRLLHQIAASAGVDPATLPRRELGAVAAVPTEADITRSLISAASRAQGLPEPLWPALPDPIMTGRRGGGVLRHLALDHPRSEEQPSLALHRDRERDGSSACPSDRG